MDISFVIPFIHEYPSIYATINNIQTEMHDSSYTYEILAVENGVVDPNTPKAFTGERALYRAIMGKRIRYAFEPRQCTGNARNLGARLARGKYIMLIDAHTTLGKNSIEPLLEFLEATPNCSCVSGLTSWSYYDRDRMGAYYELFGGGGGPTLASHMHGHYMPLGFVEHYSPFMVIMGSQCYTMYLRKDYLHVGGNFEGCRFYPHPEGLMPLKLWMCGREVWVHQDSWHIHGMMHRHYERSEAENTLERIRIVLQENNSDAGKIAAIENALHVEAEDEGRLKRAQYGNLSWYQHGVRNVFMVAYILGDWKWLDICFNELSKRDKNLEGLKASAVEIVDKLGARRQLRNIQERTLDEILIMARKTNIYSSHNKERIWGMENWDKRIGVDPLRCK